MKRTVLVTGANRGIGLAIARRLAKLGNSVLLGSRNLKAGKEIARSLYGLGLDVSPIHLDLNDSTTIDNAINDMMQSGHKVDLQNCQMESSSTTFHLPFTIMRLQVYLHPFSQVNRFLFGTIKVKLFHVSLNGR